MLLAVLAVGVQAVVFCLLLLWGWYQVTNWRILRAASKLPTFLNPLPVVGHGLNMIKNQENVTHWIMEKCQEVRDKGFSICCFWCGPLPLILLLEAEDIQKVLNTTSTAEKSFEYEYLKFAAGNGLLTAPWKVWRVTRRHLNPLFHPRNLEHMVTAFNHNSRELVADLSQHVGSTRNIYPRLMDMALKNICHLIFGMDEKVNIKSEEFRDLREVVERIPEIVMTRVVSFWLRFEWFFNQLYKHEMKGLNKMWTTFTEKPLKAATLRHEEKMNVFDATSNGGVPIDNVNQLSNEEMLNLLDAYKLLQKNYPDFSDQDLKDEMVTFYTTGSDTVGLLSSSCLLALAYYPKIQEKLWSEILSEVGQDGDVTTQDLSRMPYLDQVYKETLRFFKLVPFIGRRATEDIQLGSHFIPAGCTLVLCLEGLNMNAKVFKDPKTFDPEHFSPENLKGIDKSSFLPFSGGPRNCIGKRYAEILMKITVIHVLRNYKLTTEMDIYNLKRKLAITLVNTEGYCVYLDKRRPNLGKVLS